MNFKKSKMQPNQSLIDFAMETYGCYEGLLILLVDNMDVLQAATQEMPSGTELRVRSELPALNDTNLTVVAQYIAKGISVATGGTNSEPVITTFVVTGWAWDGTNITASVDAVNAFAPLRYYKNGSLFDTNNFPNSPSTGTFPLQIQDGTTVAGDVWKVSVQDVDGNEVFSNEYTLVGQLVATITAVDYKCDPTSQGDKSLVVHYENAIGAGELLQVQIFDPLSHGWIRTGLSQQIWQATGTIEFGGSTNWTGINMVAVFDLFPFLEFHLRVVVADVPFAEYLYRPTCGNCPVHLFFLQPTAATIDVAIGKFLPVVNDEYFDLQVLESNGDWTKIETFTCAGGFSGTTYAKSSLRSGTNTYRLLSNPNHFISETADFTV